jgi:hypothetical protein
MFSQVVQDEVLGPWHIAQGRYPIHEQFIQEDALGLGFDSKPMLQKFQCPGKSSRMKL